MASHTSQTPPSCLWPQLILHTAPAASCPEKATVVSKPTDLPWLRVEEYFKARSLAANTQKAYRYELKRFIQFIQWIDPALSDLTLQQIGQFKAYLQQKGLAKNSINRALTAVMSFCSWMHTVYPEQMPVNPTTGIELERVPLPPAQDLAPFEVMALYLALPGRGELEVRDRAILSILCHGLRADEVIRLNVGDYDGIRLNIRQAKDDSTGTVPLTQRAREDVNAYLATRRDDAGRLANEYPLFISSRRNRDGERLGYRGLYYVIKALGAIAAEQADLALQQRLTVEGRTPGSREPGANRPGAEWMQFSLEELKQIMTLTRVHPHQLRHTFATELVLKGMQSLHARTLTRHTSDSSFKRYVKRALMSAAEREFYQVMGEEYPSFD